MKNFIRAGAMALGLAVAGTAAQAVTVGTAVIGGNYTATSSDQGSTLDVDGTFNLTDSGLLALDPSKPMNYTLGASFTLNGDEDFNESLFIEDVSLNDIVFAGLFIAASLDDAFGNVPSTIIGDLLDDGHSGLFGFGNLVVTGSIDSGTPSNVLSGTFGIDLDTFLNLSDFVPFPGNDSGTFSLALSIDVAPIPLPAGLPLLLAGLGGFALLRRRQAAAA